jgi:hypothetical protein
MLDSHLHGRDSALAQALDVIHAERQHEPAEIAVVCSAPPTYQPPSTT